MREEIELGDNEPEEIGWVRVGPKREYAVFWETNTVPEGQEEGVTVIDTRGVLEVGFVVLCPPPVLGQITSVPAFMLGIGQGIEDRYLDRDPPRFPTT